MISSSFSSILPIPPRSRITTGGTRTVGEDLRQVLDRLAPHARALGSDAAFAELRTTLEQGNHAAWLRNAFADTGTLTDVVRRQAVLWAGT